jgi:hypothetical protein
LSGWCAVESQLALVHAFDVLTANRGRSADNLLFDNDLTDVTLVDHAQAFAAERALPAGFDPRSLEMPAALRQALRSLDEARLSAALGAWLDSRRIRALLARRDRLMAEP